MDRINDRNYPGYSAAGGRDPYGTADRRGRSGGSTYGAESYRSRQGNDPWNDDLWDDAGNNDNWDDDWDDDLGDDFDDAGSWGNGRQQPTRNERDRAAQDHRKMPEERDYGYSDRRTYPAVMPEQPPRKNGLLDIVFVAAAHVAIIMGLNLLVLLVIDLFFNQAMNFLGNRFFKYGCMLVIFCGMILAAETIFRVRNKGRK